jgi:hypothetical protein
VSREREVERGLQLRGLSGKFEKGVGVDALYCYAKWRCPTPQLWRQLRINGVGLDEFVPDQAGKIAYSGGHTYRIRVTHFAGRLSFVSSDGSPEDDSGKWKVAITNLGPRAATVRYLFRGTFTRPYGNSPVEHLSSLEIAGTGSFTVDPASAEERPSSVIVRPRIIAVKPGSAVLELHRKSGTVGTIELRVHTIEKYEIRINANTRARRVFLWLRAKVTASNVPCASRGKTMRILAREVVKGDKLGDVIAFRWASPCQLNDGDFKYGNIAVRIART